MRIEREAVPVDQWKPTIGEDVLLFIVHPNAAAAGDPVELAQWQGWHVGRWTLRGWAWPGLAGTVTHVAPVPPIPDGARRLS